MRAPGSPFGRAVDFSYTEATMGGTVGLQAALFDEIVARIEETDLSVPVRKGPWFYYGRTVEGSNYGIHGRRPADVGVAEKGAASAVGEDAQGGGAEGEQVILDEHLLAA